MRKGKLIVFEGIDGSGLTTQAEMLKGWLESRGYEAYLTKEPTDGPAGVQLRLALSKRLIIDPLTVALLFAADRMDQLYSDIITKLENGIIVICDRYSLSSYAYQSLDVELEWIKQINSKCIKPDLTIVLDVPTVICKRRMQKQRWHVELYEEENKLEQVRNAYLRISKNLKDSGELVEVIDGNRPKNEVSNNVIRIVKKLLLKL